MMRRSLEVWPVVIALAQLHTEPRPDKRVRKRTKLSYKNFNIPKNLKSGFNFGSWGIQNEGRSTQDHLFGGLTPRTECAHVRVRGDATCMHGCGCSAHTYTYTEIHMYKYIKT